MTQPKVDMHVRTVGNGVSVIDIRGDINAAAEQPLMDAYGQAGGSGARAIILNFSGLEYMNSSGIGLLVTLLIRANRQKQKLLSYGLNEHYRQIFELTRLNEAIEIYTNENEALSAAGKPRA
ncbi:MAG: STAS domain-containing protein [Chloroflexi bacterium]|nr:STAS domain-containing protein [Chloroflexota bacterium]